MSGAIKTIKTPITQKPVLRFPARGRGRPGPAPWGQLLEDPGGRRDGRGRPKPLPAKHWRPLRRAAPPKSSSVVPKQLLQAAVRGRLVRYVQNTDLAPTKVSRRAFPGADSRSTRCGHAARCCARPASEVISLGPHLASKPLARLEEAQPPGTGTGGPSTWRAASFAPSRRVGGKGNVKLRPQEAGDLSSSFPAPREGGRERRPPRPRALQSARRRAASGTWSACRR